MVRMHRLKGGLGLALVLIGCFSVAALGQQGTGQSISGQAGAPMPGQGELQDLVARSALIVWGRVGRTESYWQSDERGRHIYTRVTIQPVLGSIKGQVEEPLVFEVVGGTVGEIAESASNVPGFEEGEEVILFLTGDPYRLVGGHRGKLNVYDGRVNWGGIELSVKAFVEILELVTAGLSPEAVWQRESQRHELSIQAGRPYITSITPNKASAGTNT